MTELVHCSLVEGVATISLDSPHNRNALSRQLVELHGGSIEVHSGGTGQGSQFQVHLPLLDR